MIRKIVLLFLAVCLGCNYLRAQDVVPGNSIEFLEQHPYFNKAVPAINATTLNGKVFSLDNHLDMIVVLHFWSLTCAACFKELPELNRLVKEYNGKVVFISCMEESKTTLSKRFSSNGAFYILNKPVYGNQKIDFEIIPDANNVRVSYASANIPKEAVPISYFIQAGVLKNISFGYVIGQGNSPTNETANYRHLKRMLDQLLTKSEK